MTAEERPTPRVRPKPDPTEGQDPATPAVPEAVPEAVRPHTVGRARRGFRAGADPYVQLNTRVDPLLSELIEEVSSELRWSKRDVVEEALKRAYPEVYKKLRNRDSPSS